MRKLNEINEINIPFFPILVNVDKPLAIKAQPGLAGPSVLDTFLDAV
jgi:hypothetical protein